MRQRAAFRVRKLLFRFGRWRVPLRQWNDEFCVSLRWEVPANREQSHGELREKQRNRIRQDSNGKWVKTETARWELSSDGMSLTLTAIAFRTSGPVIIGKLIASRISGSDDFSGRWQDRSFLQRHAGLTLRLDNQYLRIGSPSAGVDAPLNGTDVTPHGINAIAGMTYAVRKIGEREFLIRAKFNGKEVRQESLKLSDDNLTVIDYWSNLVQTNGKATLVYEKR